ncbi:MAG: TIGR00725 family protein [Actinomycetota bacterium]|nr:TIGR00725 family protein [Actinomycetota bacterium]
MSSSAYVAVVGAGEASPAAESEAETVGRLLAERGAVVVCGGLGGVMAAACRGAKSAGGTTVGILPGSDRSEANPWVDVAVPTGMGEARNAVVVRTVDAVVAVAGGYGTLSEMALALRLGRPVVTLGGWEIDGVQLARDPSDAVQRALDGLS